MPATAALTIDVELDLGLPDPVPRSAPKSQRRRQSKTERSEHLWFQPVLSEAMLAVGEFHVAFSLPLHRRPQVEIPRELVQLRIDLLQEEVDEFRQAAVAGQIVGVADALGDILYVVYGTALTYGIDLDAIVREVHRSNMSKLGPAGVPILRADGKVLKPSTFSPPDVERVLNEQPPLPFLSHAAGPTHY